MYAYVRLRLHACLLCAVCCRHVVFAPSATDSYASAAFPGISDALYKIEMNDEPAWDRVRVSEGVELVALANLSTW